LIDKDEAQAGVEQFKGKVERAVGKATGSKRMEDRGKTDEVKGSARRAVADARSDARNIAGKAKQITARR
jgi:uncharacterized protein YjbJ (UPF0337 family)